MLNSGETADKMVDYSLRFGEMAMRLSGRATINLVNYLTALSKDNKKTKGKTRLVRMLKEGRELKVFQIDQEQMKAFAQMAKKYGILFTALRDKKNPDNMLDLMVKIDDMSKVDRVLQRLKIASYDAGQIKATLEKDQQKNSSVPGRPNDVRSDAYLKEKNRLDQTAERPSIRQRLQSFRASMKSRDIAAGQIELTKVRKTKRGR